jgi:xylose isomerase
VIALGKGGILDSMSADTAFFYDEATIEGLVKAIRAYEQRQHLFRPELLRERANEFSEERFLARFSLAVEQALIAHAATQVAGALPASAITRILGEL